MRRGFDGGVIDAFIIVPPLVAVAWFWLLAGTFNEAAVAIVWLVLAIALRPVIWLWAGHREGVSEERKKAYAERKRNSINTSFAAMALLGLMAYDIPMLPGGPYWTNQPRAGFALVPVCVYLVWLGAFERTTIPQEVACGWRRLFGKEG